MVRSETINIWTFKEGPTPFHCLLLTICLCFVGLELQITVLEVYLFSFFASQNNDIGLLLPSIHLLVVLVNPLTHLLENIDLSVARTLFRKKWRTWPNPCRKSVGASNAWGEGRTFVFVRCAFQTCNNFSEAVDCSLSGDWKPFLHGELALIRSALCCSFNQFLPFLMIRYPSLAIVGYSDNSSPRGLWRSFSSFTIYTIFSVSNATTPATSNNIPTKSRKGSNFETSWGGNTFYDEITASEINSIIAVLRGL